MAANPALLLLVMLSMTARSPGSTDANASAVSLGTAQADRFRVNELHIAPHSESDGRGAGELVSASNWRSRSGGDLTTRFHIGLSSLFGFRLDPFTGLTAMHNGIDISDRAGAPVFATARGTVVSAGRNGGCGLMVEIDHGGSFLTKYCHLSHIFVKIGQRVGRDSEIGAVGSTGRSTGSHLHYEVRYQGRPVDPRPFL